MQSFVMTYHVTAVANLSPQQQSFPIGASVLQQGTEEKTGGEMENNVLYKF